MTGKKLFFILFVTFTGILALCLVRLGYKATWQLWNITTYSTPFVDLQLITGGAQSYAAGYDPAFENPFDPFQRFFNYPRIWYLILALPIDLGDTLAIGLVQLFVFYASLFLFVPDFDRFTAVLLATVVFSSEVLLGLERGNVDIIFFVLLAISLHFSGFRNVHSFAILTLSILFKIFPVFSIGYFLDQTSKKSFRWVVGGLGVLAVYFSITFQDMIHVFRVTGRGRNASYGANVFSLYLSNETGISASLLNGVFLGAALVVALTVVLFALRRNEKLAASNERFIRAFRAGAGIYVGTFLLGSNFDYRLMFLIFAIPQLAVWLHSRSYGVIARLTVVTLILSSWNLFLQKFFQIVFSVSKQTYFYFDELMNWLLFLSLLYLFILSLPDWMIEDWQRFLERLRGNTGARRDLQ